MDSRVRSTGTRTLPNKAGNMGMQEIADLLGIHRSTLFRLLSQRTGRAA
ncbi:hypothetical protein EVC45_43935 [Paraburkholderia sp. UYCP14C]|nr:hypothetical protein EVC45_43935 [Paraburkholderia sp. UYCP14C]